MVPLALMAWCYAKILGSRSHSSGAPTTAQARQRGTRCSWSASAAPPTYRPNPGSSRSLYKSVPAEERHLGVDSGFGGAIAFYVWRETAGETLSTVVFFSSPTGERCVVETTRELLQNAPAGGSRQGRGVVHSGSVAQTLAASPLQHPRRGRAVLQTSQVRIAQLPLHREKRRRGSRSRLTYVEATYQPLKIPTPSGLASVPSCGPSCTGTASRTVYPCVTSSCAHRPRTT